MITEQVNPLAARVAALEAQIEALLARDERRATPEPDPERPVSRRRLIGMAGVAAAGAVGATALAASPAGANDPNDVTVDAIKTGVGVTQLNSSVGGGSAALFVSNTNVGTDAIGVLGSSIPGKGVQGSTDTGKGVVGFANGVGVGVQAFSFGGGIALECVAPLSNNGAHMLLHPHSTITGPPISGTHSAGELWMDATTRIWQCTGTGTPGAWNQMMIPGVSNNAGVGQTILTTTNPNVTLSVSNESFSATADGLLGQSAGRAGVRGTGTLFGVQGIGTTGVYGESNNGGPALAAICTNPNVGGAHVKLTPGGVAGPPTAGTHALGEFYVDSAGKLWQCSTAGVPGGWNRALLVGANHTGGVAPTIVSSDTGSPAFLGTNTSSIATADGVAGTSGSGRAGVFASGNQYGLLAVGGIGVKTTSSGPGVALEAVCVDPNIGGAHLRLTPGGVAGAPTAQFHTLGEFYVDSAGKLWQCTVTGTPGTWVNLSAPSGGSGSGLVPLPAPSRVYDSRTGQANPSGSPQGSLAFGAAARTINCSPAVPGGATTILFNLTATGTAGAGAGALLLWAAGVSQPVASSINWSGAGQTLANAVTSACNASQDVQVRCVASTGSSTQFIIDVIGYYL